MSGVNINDYDGNKQAGPGTGLSCTAGDAQSIDLANNAVANATTVIGTLYVIFAPMVGVVAVGQGADPDTDANVVAVIPPGGSLRIKATAVTIRLYCKDTTDGYGSDFDGTAYVLKVASTR